MRTRILLVATLVAAALLICAPPAADAPPRDFGGTGQVRRTCPSSGPSAAATLQPGFYLVTVDGERACVCQGSTSCADNEASNSLCLRPGMQREINVVAVTPVSCWSAATAGVAEWKRWVP